jgi:carboxyl-terminal processing protease
MTTDDIPQRWQGLWRSQGYNKLLKIEPTGYSLYTATQHHACLYERGSARQFAAAFDRLQIDETGQLTLFHANDITRYTFEAMKDWPSGCRIHSQSCDEPLVSFEAFCELFAENYAFFELRGVDWAHACAAGEHRLRAEPSPDLLLEVLESLIAPLADLHVYVATPERKLRSMSRARGPRVALQRVFSLPTPSLSARAAVDAISPHMAQTLLGEYQKSLRGFRRAGNGVLAWGTLDSGVGYLSLLRMFGFAASERARGADDLPHLLHEAGPFMAEDMSSLEDALDEAFADLSEGRSLVVDLRLNGGGFDRAGMLLCDRLTGKASSAFRKKARSRNGFGPAQAITINPSPGARFTKPVFALISPFTQSAGEVCALAMASLPNVSLLGEPTQGILSDNLFHRLPNGWEVSLSNEIYEAIDGRCFESVGVPVDTPLPPLGEELLQDLRSGLRLAVARASSIA